MTSSVRTKLVSVGLNDQTLNITRYGPRVLARRREGEGFLYDQDCSTTN